MPDWVRRLFNLEKEPCQACEVLKRELEIAHERENQLLDKLINPPKPEPLPEIKPEALKPKHIPWNVRRQMLEEEDKRKAEVMRRMEQEMGIENASEPESIERASS